MGAAFRLWGLSAKKYILCTNTNQKGPEKGPKKGPIFQGALFTGRAARAQESGDATFFRAPYFGPPGPPLRL